jgi:hypothetical protein
MEPTDGESSRVDGIGFVFSDEDQILGIDLDHCIDSDGQIDQWARVIIDEVDSYTEISPSGTGVHIIAKGTLPEDGKNRRGDVEIYDSDRYFTVTGNHIKDTPETIEQRQEAVESVYATHIESTETRSLINTGGGDTSSAAAGGLSDDEVIEKASKARGREKFTRLWDGDISKYQSQSEADLALCNLLAFWTAKDRRQIDRLFRRSGLMREKWDEKRGSRTYGEATIDKSMKEVTNTYEAAASNGTQKESDPSRQVTLRDVKDTVREEFDRATWEATEALLSAHATLLIDNKSGGVGLMLVGPSSSGKTTVLSFFDNIEEQFYRSDELTPASFVSHDSSKSSDRLSEIDLLPRVARKSLVARDMSTWFSGDQDQVSKRMSTMTYLLDGNGYTRDSGSHGRRGYEGDEYRFNLFGATTPLKPRAWQVMGNVGNRLLFHEKRGATDLGSVIDDIVDGSEYSIKVNRCREAIYAYLKQLWADTDGFGGVEWKTGANGQIKQVLKSLVRIVRRARASSNDDEFHPEGGHRIGSALYDVARGHALLDGRDQVIMSDLHVCARIALSTMPAKRRPVIQALLNPASSGTLTANEVESLTGVSRPTALDRMDELVTLGFAVPKEQDDGRNPKVIEVRPEYRWPDGLDFPDFGS